MLDYTFFLYVKELEGICLENLNVKKVPFLFHTFFTSIHYDSRHGNEEWLWDAVFYLAFRKGFDNLKKIIVLILAILLLTGCNRVTYTKIDKNQPFVATVNIKDTSITFVNEQFKRFAQWDLNLPFNGGLLLNDRDTLLLYGKDMDSIAVYSLSKGNQIDSWKVDKGIVKMMMLKDGKSIVALNQTLNTVSFYNVRGQLKNQVEVGKSPLLVLEGNRQLYVINFDDTKLSVINLKTRRVDKEIQINHSSTGALLREDKHEIWIGGHGKGEKMEENVHVYSTKTGELKRLIKAPMMPVKIQENTKGIYILSHGSNKIYKLNSNYQIVKSANVGVNPFEMSTYHDNILIASYDSNELYVMDADHLKIKKIIKVGKGPFQIISRE